MPKAEYAVGYFTEMGIGCRRDPLEANVWYVRAAENGNENAKQRLKIIRSESERLTNLIASLLQLARSDSGALVMARDPILSGLFLTEIARELMPLAQAQRTALTVAGQEVTFEGDADRLKQVLINLVSNALKYHHPDRAPLVQVSCHHESDGLVLRVQDNGLGLSEQQQAKLFQLFERLHTHVEGTGVGLYMVKKIVENAGGTLSVQSCPGQGTTFIASFPA